MQYGILLSGNSVSSEQIKKRQKLQNKSLKLVTNKNTKDVYNNKELGILDIKSQIELANLKFGYKLHLDLLPAKINNKCLVDSKNLQT